MQGEYEGNGDTTDSEYESDSGHRRSWLDEDEKNLENRDDTTDSEYESDSGHRRSLLDEKKLESHGGRNGDAKRYDRDNRKGRWRRRGSHSRDRKGATHDRSVGKVDRNAGRR